jgi:hypothetical protein
MSNARRGSHFPQTNVYLLAEVEGAMLARLPPATSLVKNSPR